MSFSPEDAPSMLFCVDQNGKGLIIIILTGGSFGYYCYLDLTNNTFSGYGYCSCPSDSDRYLYLGCCLWKSDTVALIELADAITGSEHYDAHVRLDGERTVFRPQIVEPHASDLVTFITRHGYAMKGEISYVDGERLTVKDISLTDRGYDASRQLIQSNGLVLGFPASQRPKIYGMMADRPKDDGHSHYAIPLNGPYKKMHDALPSDKIPLRMMIDINVPSILHNFAIASGNSNIPLMAKQWTETPRKCQDDDCDVCKMEYEYMKMKMEEKRRKDKDNSSGCHIM